MRSLEEDSRSPGQKVAKEQSSPKPCYSHYSKPCRARFFADVSIECEVHSSCRFFLSPSSWGRGRSTQVCLPALWVTKCSNASTQSSSMPALCIHTTAPAACWLNQAMVIYFYIHFLKKLKAGGKTLAWFSWITSFSPPKVFIPLFLIFSKHQRMAILKIKHF